MVEIFLLNEELVELGSEKDDFKIKVKRLENNFLKQCEDFFMVENQIVEI